MAARIGSRLDRADSSASIVAGRIGLPNPHGLWSIEVRPSGLGFGILGSGFVVKGLGFRVWGVGLGVLGLV